MQGSDVMKVSMKMVAAATCLTLPAVLLAAPQVYSIDPGHTYPSFEVSHEGLSYWRGKFDKTSGKILLDRAAKTGQIDIQIDTTSINFGLPVMNKHAQGEDFFQTDKYPTATFHSTSIAFDGDKPVSINGDLTIRGITKPVKLQVKSFKCIQDPMFKREHCGADVRTEFDRRDFGMTRNIVPSDPNVRLAIQVEAFAGALPDFSRFGGPGGPGGPPPGALGNGPPPGAAGNGPPKL